MPKRVVLISECHVRSAQHRHQRACYTVSITSPKRIYMDIQSIVTQLKQELSRIERAIAALVGLGSQPTRRGRPPKVTSGVHAGGQKRRTMSASARAKIAAAQRARWAKQRSQAASKKPAAQKKTTGRKPMSPTMRKKLSALMKARWAARKRRKSH
jgi:hypothetical protein